MYETPTGRINIIETPSANPAGDAVLCIHGLCNDARIFSYAATRLSQAGYNVYSMDLPGHGMSEGKRGDLDFDLCMKSIDQIVSDLKKNSSRVFILAHSMGSTFALWYAHLFKGSIDGLIVMSPYVRIGGIKRSDADPTPSAFLYLVLGRIFAPGKRVDIRKLLPGYVKIGGTQLDRMMQDSQLNFHYSHRYLMDVIAKRNSKVRELSDVDVPILVLSGSKDRNVYPEVSERFFRLVRAKDKEAKIFDCNHWFYDAIFYSQSPEYGEEERTEFISSIVGWLDSAKAKATGSI